MNHSIRVMPVPPPTSVEFETCYVVVRGDGLCKIFHELSTRGPPQVWSKLADKYLSDYNMRIHIPVDILTAVYLGLIEFDELQLPEGTRALLNLIK